MKINNPNKMLSRNKLESLVYHYNNFEKKPPYWLLTEFIDKMKIHNTKHRDDAKIIKISTPQSSYLTIIYE